MRRLVEESSVKSKRTTLMDVSERRFMPEKTKVRDNYRSDFCQRNICTHEFLEHGNFDVPWWACYNEQCAEHHAMKVKNRGMPTLPTVMILNSDKCPCLRKGCICGFSQHQFHRGLVTMKQCLDNKCMQYDVETSTIYDKDQEISIFRKEIQDVTTEIRNLVGNVTKIRKTCANTTNGSDCTDKRRNGGSYHRQWSGYKLR